MPSLETSTWLALKARIATLSLSPSLPIAYPKEAFDAPQGGTPKRPLPYLEVKHLPNSNTRLGVGDTDSHRRAGILRIILKYPTSMNNTAGIAESQQMEIAGQIAAHFPTGLPMISGGLMLKVEKAPDVGGSFIDGSDPYHQTPVSIRYEAFA